MTEDNEKNIINSAIKEFEKNEIDLSETLFFKTLIINPKSFIPLFYLGLISLKKSKLTDAELFFTSAYEINSNDHILLFNLGFTKHQLNKKDDAALFYEKSIKIKKTVMALNNLSSIYWETNQKNESIECLKKSLKIEEYPTTLANLSNFLLQTEKFSESLNYSTKAISLSKEFKLSLIVNFINALNALKSEEFPENNNETLNALEFILETNSEKPILNDNFFKIIFKDYDLTKLRSLGIVKNNQIIEASVVSKSLNDGFQIFDDYEFLKILTSKIICLYLSNELVSNKHIENILSKAREYIITKVDKDKKIKFPNLIKFLESISIQSEFNDYIWSISDQEKKILDNLEKNFNNYSGEEKLINAIIYSCYFPIKNSKDVSSFLEENQNYSSGIKKIIDRQIHLPRDIDKETKKINSLGLIKNNVSKNVKKQYEDFPYPLWKSKFIKDHDQKIYTSNLKDVADNIPKPDILIAGCGTGREAIGMARLKEDSNILAVDLSMKSLSYASIKSKENNIKNIEFLNADILDLEKLGKKFDIISSCGVLHHMESPERGLKTLSKILKNNGYIKLAFYSSYARQGLSELKDYIYHKKLTNKIEDLRKLRELVKNKKIDIKIDFLEQTEKSLDFYSSNELRDLLFHPSEINFNLIEINQLLSNCNLEFIEFDNKYIKLKNYYKKIFPDDSNGSNLHNWDLIEKKQPTIFSSMYIFWAKLLNERTKE
tara:strand:+ start:5606 stop:7759 length:2154 start_codon:yes stop_codon:yes gene_type:complete